MILIIGGAFQGKRTFAEKVLGVPAEAFFTCTDEKPDLSAPCIDALEEYVLSCVHLGLDPLTYFQENQELWRDSVIICRDIFCGVVPVDSELRTWRQETGRLCQYLSTEADQVSRIFCGLEQRLK